ncbi:MAG: hypothetical protein RJA15_907 [Actinomycetota bacterium]|jgi:uncharacterized membrane protein
MNFARLVSRARHVKPDDGGVVAVEFALVLPLLIVLIFTVVLGGSVYVDQLHLQSVARDAARAGSVDATKACPLALAELSSNDVGTVQCSVVKSCSLSTGVAEIQLTSVQTVSVPLVGDRVVTLNASSSFICAP